MDLVYSPLMDIKEFPRDVDITLVEGAVANEDNARMLRLIRERTDVLVAFGDCASSVAMFVSLLRTEWISFDVTIVASRRKPEVHHDVDR